MEIKEHRGEEPNEPVVGARLFVKRQGIVSMITAVDAQHCIVNQPYRTCFARDNSVSHKLYSIPRVEIIWSRTNQRWETDYDDNYFFDPAFRLDSYGEDFDDDFEDGSAYLFLLDENCPECGSVDRNVSYEPCGDSPSDWHYARLERQQ
jgi:hypothetical protein